VRRPTRQPARPPFGVPLATLPGAAVEPGATPGATSPPPGPLTAGLPDFTAVAARTVPAVANISSTQVIARQNSPFSNDRSSATSSATNSDLYGPQSDVERSLGSGVIVSADGYIRSGISRLSPSADADRRQLPQRKRPDSPATT